LNRSDSDGDLVAFVRLGLRADAPAPGEPHVPDDVLAAAAEQAQALSASQIAHLARCAECASAFAAAAELVAPAPARATESRRIGPRRARRVWLPLALAASCALALGLGVRLLVHPADGGAAGERVATGGGLPAGGASDPGFALVAIDAAGHKRELGSESRVLTSERIVVRSAPRGRAPRAVVLGWDGSELHWYSPASPDSQPLPLPLEIPLAAGHRPGPLRVVVTLGSDAVEAAREIQSNLQVGTSRRSVFELDLVTP
jgi:hypothetical protein